MNGHVVRGSRQDRSLRQVLTRFARAVLLRCPVCGRGGLFTSWFKLRARCPNCGFALEREEGYFTGAMAVNLIVTELVLTTILITLLVVTWPLAASWPSPPLTTAWFIAIAAAGILPILTYPFSRTVWIAFDLVFRPPMEQDFQERIPRVR
jgi:uncharacterized protein (DUF983 family)